MVHIEDFPIVTRRTVSWGQMDAYRHVNNVEYFRFIEDARIAYFEAMGIYATEDLANLPEVGPILASASCRFLAPLVYPDTVLIGARTTEVGEERFTMEYAVASETAGRVVAVADSVVVSYAYREGKKAKLPQSWRDAIAAIEAKTQPE